MRASNLEFRPYDFGGNGELRGTYQQTDYGLAYVKRKEPNAFTTNSDDFMGSKIHIAGWSFQNRSGSAAVVGIAARLSNKYWVAGRYDHSALTFIDDTTDAQDTGTDDFASEVAAEADDGFYVSASVPFNLLSFNVSTASVKGTTVARALKHVDETGAAYDTITTSAFVQDGLADDYATGEQIIAFPTPPLWGKGALSNALITTYTGDGLNHPFYAASRYLLLVQSTDAPDTTAALFKAMEVWRLFLGTEALADNGNIEHMFPYPITLGAEFDAVHIYSSSSSIQNRGTLLVAEG